MIRKTIGVLIITIGFSLTIYTGLDNATNKKVLNKVSSQIKNDRGHKTNWYPLIGIGITVMGGFVFASGSKNHINLGSSLNK